MGKIIIKRLPAYGDALRDYKIYIDGKKIGSIGEGESKEFEVPEGKHIIYGKIDCFKSQKIAFDIVDNNEKYFEVKSNMSFIKLGITIFTGMMFARFIVGKKHDIFYSILYFVSSLVIMLIIYYLLYIKTKYISLKMIE